MSILVRLVKQRDGTTLGITLPTGASFIGLRQSLPPDRAWMTETVSLGTTSRVQINENLRESLRKDETLRFFLHVTMPSLQHRVQYRDGPKEHFTSYDVLYFSDALLLAARHDQALGSGDWQHVIKECQRWEHLGRPDLGAYHVEVDTQGQPRFAVHLS